MAALRDLKTRSGLSHRDIATRMSRISPQHAVAKSTLASLFAQDTLPRRPGQLAALIDVLASELYEPADRTADLMNDWSRLMADRASAAAPVLPPEPSRAPGSSRPRHRATDLDEGPSLSRNAGIMLAVICNVLAIAGCLAVWLWVRVGSFGDYWLLSGSPLLAIILLTQLLRRPDKSRMAGRPAGYLRDE